MCVSYDFLSCFVWLGKIGCKIKIKRGNILSNDFLFTFIVKKKPNLVFSRVFSRTGTVGLEAGKFPLYYNHERPHSGLGGKLIDPWPQDEDSEIMEFSRLGGLLKSCRRIRMRYDGLLI